MHAPRFSEAVLDAAICKAVEAGVFPRRSTMFEAAINREIMREILEAAYTAACAEEADGDTMAVPDDGRATAERAPPRVHLSLQRSVKASDS